MQHLINRCEQQTHQHELSRFFEPLAHPMPHPQPEQPRPGPITMHEPARLNRGTLIGAAVCVTFWGLVAWLILS